jgi:acetyl-CoA carboxylase biotin carboxyl carrier protein
LLKLTDIHELIRLLDESSLSELNLEYEDVKLNLKKEKNVTLSSVGTQSSTTAQPTATVLTEVQQVPANTTEATEDSGLHLLTSPMVGTFYKSPSPDTPAFVEIGSLVNPKTVVCIVEAMKLMNEIEAEVSGEIVEILVQNGELVEYGQPLFKIRLT